MVRTRRSRISLLCILVVVTAPRSAFATDDEPEIVILPPTATASADAASLIGMGFNGGPGALEISTALTGLDGNLWPQADLDDVVPLRSAWLPLVIDRKGLGGLGKRMITPGREEKIPGVFDNPEEGLPFRDAVGKAARTRPEVFARRSRHDLRNSDFLNEALEKSQRIKNKPLGDVSQAAAAGGVGFAAWRKASEEPRPSLRGEIVHVEGTLRRVYAIQVAGELRTAGVGHLWEGWVLDRNNQNFMWYILFTELPEEIGQETNESLEQEIEFDGYYLKVMTYESLGTKSNPGKIEEAVVVIGRAPVIVSAKPGRRDPWSELIAPGIAVFVCVTLLVLGVLTWSFNRGDRKVRARLAANRTVEIPDTIPGQLHSETDQTDHSPPEP